MLTAIIAAFVGIKGLTRWREETVGKRKSELAEHVLADFYQAKDIFEWVRFPISYPEEGAARPRNDGENDAEARVRDAYYVPIQRLAKEAEFLGAMQARKYRFVALFGADAGIPFRELKEIQAEIVTAARMLARGNANALHLPDLEAKIWTMGEQDDIKRRINHLIGNVEAICRPTLSARART